MSYDHVEDDDEQSMICNVCPKTCAVEAYAFKPTVSVTGANMSGYETLLQLLLLQPNATQ